MIALVLLIASSFALGVTIMKIEMIGYAPPVAKWALLLNSASISFNGLVVAHRLGLL